MKNLKMFAVVFGLMLSVTGVFAKTALETNIGLKNTDCLPIAVDEDCRTEHSGATCQVDLIEMVHDDVSCSQILKRTF